jgi:glycosyltransferase involved in cell wall biosynthesis
MTPLVSVVVPTHNRASLLARTLRSVQGQTLSDLEIIVVDDGSTEPVAVVPREWLRVVRHEHPLGVSAARNRGIAEALGEWVAFCDDDDVWAPAKLEEQLIEADREHAAWVYAGDVNVDVDLRVISGGPPPDAAAAVRDLPRFNPISSGGSNVMVRAQLLNEVGRFDEGLRRTEDWDLWIRLARAGPPACVRRPLVAYRFHQGNVAPDTASMVLEARLLAGRHRIPVDMTRMHRRAAWTALRSGRRVLALRHYVDAIVAGDLASVGRAAVAITYPGVAGNSLFTLLGRDAAWIASAEEWLKPLAALERMETS